MYKRQLQLSRLYNLPMTPAAARLLLTRLSSHNALLGGVQLGLAALKQALLLLVPSKAMAAAVISGQQWLQILLQGFGPAQQPVVHHGISFGQAA